jgi:tetratricopeptide (TPR) repeat protein
MNTSSATEYKYFSNSAMANLEYWIREVDEQPDKNVSCLKPDLSNLVSAFQFGIVSSITFELAVELLIKISPIFVSLRTVDNWVDLVRSAINKTPEQRMEIICTLYNILGYLCSLDNQLKKSQNSHFYALTYAIIAGNTMERANARLGIAKNYLELKHYQRAKKIAQGVIVELGNTSSPNVQAIAALNILGIVAHNQKLYAEARQYFGRIMRLYHGKPKGRQHAIAQCNLAITHFAEENFADCLKLLAKSRRTLSKSLSNYWTMKLDYVYGITFLKLGELDKAEKCFLRAITFYFQHIPNPSLIRHLYQCLGITLGKMAKYKLADLYLEKSADLLNPNPQFPPNAVDDLMLRNT